MLTRSKSQPTYYKMIFLRKINQIFKQCFYYQFLIYEDFISCVFFKKLNKSHAIIKELTCSLLFLPLHKLKYLLLLILINTSWLGFSQNLTIVSWNIRDFGKSRDDSEIYLIANLVKDVDVIAIQEVVAKDPGGAQAVARLAEQLDRMGADWDYSISDPTNSPSPYISERYAYLWKTAKVKKLGEARLINELDQSVYREPYLITFLYQGKKLTLINYHSRTHDSNSSEYLEIESISNWILSKNFENCIWAGDFNLDIRHLSYSKLLNSGFNYIIESESTTLKNFCKDGDYLSFGEDNIIYRLSDLRFSHKKIFDFIAGRPCEEVKDLRVSFSDHLPIALNITIN